MPEEMNRIFSIDDVDITDLERIINIPEIQDMMNHFYELTHIGMAITDMNGNVLVATGWQDICTKFHRCHPETLRNCVESDTNITQNPVKGKYTIYKCKNNMWDIATPLFLGGKHVANLFTGQFFFEDEVPDYEFFREQARKYGFDEAEYLSAVDRVPRWSRAKVYTAMEFYTRLAGMINSLSYSNIHLQNMLSKQKEAEEEIQKARMQAELYLDLMGHDITNINMIVLGYLELARNTTQENREHVESLDKSSEVLQRSTRLIQNVRTLQKLQDIVVPTEPVDVCQVLQEIRQEYGSIPGKTVDLNLNGLKCCTVRANYLLNEVFANLVSNAIKHTRGPADIRIDLGIVEENGEKYCRVRVIDNGPGIPEDFKKKIFNRMLKGTDKAKGMGLGLYLVKSLVDSYHGKVWVEDRVPGDYTKGAKFVVILPLTIL
ncbi:PocR ligand-binding domain-containing protein [Methanocella sp. MCL-LM]|uniref:PocR ligand-binding domain-containing protein n=1 Tax=Methanocella sp. MCL-LM TaxID=3412035 RepID=UPI003C7413A6